MGSAGLIGARVTRREDLRLVQGKGTYVDDLNLPGTLTLALVRSPYAHARIVSIDTSGAAVMPGVERVLTAGDLGPANRPLMVMVPPPSPQVAVTQRPLATDRVLYQGEAVAAVLAHDRYVAEDAAQAVVVEYEPLATITDPCRALDPDAPVLHPERPNNEVGSWRMSVGDVETAFANADLVVELEVEVGRTAGHPLETRGVVAYYDPVQDMLTVWTSTQVPHRIRSGLAQALDRPEDSIRVIVPDVGGGFGSKLCLYPEEVLCAYLALVTGRPIKWTEDRREHFLTTAHGRGQVHHIRLALRKDGTIQGLKDRFWHDNGAYAPYGIRVALVTAKALMGPYRIPNYDVEFVAVYTNKAPVIPYRGAGQPEAVFAIERALDQAARRLGIEPVEIRRRNMIPPEAFPYDTGLVYPGLGPVIYDSGNYPATLAAVAERIDLSNFRQEQARARRDGRYIGVGFGCYVEETGTGAFEGALVRVDATGYVTVVAGICSQGQGHETMFAQVVAQALGVPMDRIRVKLGDTGLLPYGVGTWGSRAAAVAASAAREASLKVRDKAVRLAAYLLEAAPEDIRLEGGEVFVVGAPHHRIGLAELAQASAPGRGSLPLPEGPGLEAIHYFPPKAITYAHGVHAAIVEVDPTTCQVKLLRYVVAHDCGKRINPAIVDGQVFGGVAQGVGGALYERLVYENGQLLTTSFMDYLIPTATEVPAVEILHQETPSPMNPGGFKGAGEGGVIPAAAAIVGAVEDALAHLGAVIARTPVTPDLLHSILSAEGERP